ncbi:MAG: cell division protein SepF [Actinomycetota bacterium]|nr:MAG: cell division protein SepF [Actinomycetota bacterium]
MSKFQKAMVWLGLTDAEDDDESYDDFENTGSRRARHYRPDSSASQAPQRVQVSQAPQELSREERDNIRHLVNERRIPTASSDYAGPDRHGSMDARPQEPRVGFVKPVPAEKPKLHLSQPLRFSDVQEIGDRFKERQLVLVDMAELPKDLSRRIIDFCAGSTYALEGRIEKLSEAVLLLSPANVELSPQDKDKLLERLRSRTDNQ